MLLSLCVRRVYKVVSCRYSDLIVTFVYSDVVSRAESVLLPPKAAVVLCTRHSGPSPNAYVFTAVLAAVIFVVVCRAATNWKLIHLQHYSSTRRPQLNLSNSSQILQRFTRSIPSTTCKVEQSLYYTQILNFCHFWILVNCCNSFIYTCFLFFT